jgi:hypothetical protein
MSTATKLGPHSTDQIDREFEALTKGSFTPVPPTTSRGAAKPSEGVFRFIGKLFLLLMLAGVATYMLGAVVPRAIDTSTPASPAPVSKKAARSVQKPISRLGITLGGPVGIMNEQPVSAAPAALPKLVTQKATTAVKVHATVAPKAKVTIVTKPVVLIVPPGIPVDFSKIGTHHTTASPAVVNAGIPAVTVQTAPADQTVAKDVVAQSNPAPAPAAYNGVSPQSAPLPASSSDPAPQPANKVLTNGTPAPAPVLKVVIPAPVVVVKPIPAPVVVVKPIPAPVVVKPIPAPVVVKPIPAPVVHPVQVTVPKNGNGPMTNASSTTDNGTIGNGGIAGTATVGQTPTGLGVTSDVTATQNFGG